MSVSPLLYLNLSGECNPIKHILSALPRVIAAKFPGLDKTRGKRTDMHTHPLTLTHNFAHTPTHTYHPHA